MKQKISGWGKNISKSVNIYYPENLNQLKKKVKKNCIARGLGRSYGDSSIQPLNTIVTTKLNKIINFDKKKGILEAESGANIEQLLNLIVKEGWFLPVTPGSKKVTLGGMIASDVHGKNHHKVGSFSNYIISFKILTDKKKLINCNKKKNNKLFKYTIGGMGLTGIIFSCKIRLKKIESNKIVVDQIKNYNLKETLKSINDSKNWEYNVAWIDTSPDDKQLGRSILSRGYFLKEKNNNFFYNKDKLIINNLPNIFPFYFMNSLFIKILNFIYFRFSKTGKKNTTIDEFFYPLDKINNWNVIYGKNGFISYQCSVPLKNSYETIYKILATLKKYKIYSFVSVLKSMKQNNYLLSFGQKGFTLVFDFPIYPTIFDVLNKIDDIVLKNNGRIYLTKDSRILNKNFYKINKEFKNNDFKKFRNKINYYFNSLQSKRLGI